MQDWGRLPELAGRLLPPRLPRTHRWLKHPIARAKASTALQGKIWEINYCEYRCQQITPLSVVPNQTVIIAFML